MKWLIYPYSPKSIPILKNKELLTCGEISCISAPMGYGLDGKTGYIWGEEQSEYIINSKMQSDFDGIWITPEISYMSIDEILQSIMKFPIANKKIYYPPIFSKEEEGKILTLLNELGAGEVVKETAMLDEFELSVKDKILHKFKTPIIAVAGIGTYTQKFDLQLYLRKELIKMGYKVSQIGSRPYGEMFGFHSMPKWMFDTTFTEKEKVYAFNHYLKTIEWNENPEVIIIGIPEGIMPFNEKHSQGFGLTAYEICSGVHPDYFIMSLYNGEYTSDFFDEIRNLTKYRLHVEIDDFYISNYVPISTSFKKEQLVFTYSESGNENREVFYYKDLEKDALIKRIIECLSDYDKYEII